VPETVASPKEGGPAAGFTWQHREDLHWCAVTPAEAGAVSDAHDVVPPEGYTFRAAPLLEVVDGEHGVIAVGQTQVWVAQNGTPWVAVLVRAMWHVGDDDRGRWEPVAVEDEKAQTDAVVARILSRLRSGSPDGGDTERFATAMAKHFAERSRDAVAGFRQLRYAVEHSLAHQLRHSTKELDHTLSDVLELSTVASRARDEAREAARAGLWAWRNDASIYHAQRRLLDPSLPERDSDQEGRDRPWFVLYDAAVRQAVQMERQLGEETSAFGGLLTAASTIAVTRDARSQHTFNWVAGMGGILLGLPALILAMYGAGDLLPLGPTTYGILLPVVAAGLVALAIALFLPGMGAGRAKRFWATLAAVLVTIALLYWAGREVPAKILPAPAPGTTQAVDP